MGRFPTRENATPTPQPVSDAEHFWRCWDEKDGPGRRVRDDVGTIKKRMWYLNGGVAVVVALGLLVLGRWIDARLTAGEKNSIKRDDIEQVVRKRFEVDEAKRFDDAHLDRLRMQGWEARAPR